MNNLITFVPCATTRCSTDLEVQVSYLPEEAVLRDLDLVRAEEIAPFYPGTEVDYLLKKFKAQKLSARRCGEPLLATVRDNSLVVGCLVVTPKAFRSQKLGPIWVRDEYRGRGVPEAMLGIVRRSTSPLYQYMTIPSENTRMKQAALRLGFLRSAAVPSLYRPGRTEEVYTYGKDVLHKHVMQPSFRSLLGLMSEITGNAASGHNLVGLSMSRKRGGAVSISWKAESLSMQHVTKTDAERLYFSVLPLSASLASGFIPRAWEVQELSETSSIAYLEV